MSKRGPIHAASQWSLKDQGEYSKYYEYNPAESRRLLVEASYPNGFSTLFWITGTSDASELWADYLDAIGIKVTIKPLESETYSTKIYVGHASKG